ncbi:hypothetical protein P280DRAFT_214926 [Massarina eburnea CBS 473.64]|uniref:Uncharacterized protein n=1 Tax=Massarina eburnea CBS 473.64 TaxID=1395130 RepID=A0A6A6SC04_9PLEO|nr:hypothetical protein P280DRAFT_214926 [Massarina eburnea CBS 473.64]
MFGVEPAVRKRAGCFEVREGRGAAWACGLAAEVTPKELDRRRTLYRVRPMWRDKGNNGDSEQWAVVMAVVMAAVMARGGFVYGLTSADLSAPAGGQPSARPKSNLFSALHYFYDSLQTRRTDRRASLRASTRTQTRTSAVIGRVARSPSWPIYRCCTHVSITLSIIHVRGNCNSNLGGRW